MGAGGFWSYVHADDDAEGGRIAELARDVKTQYELITGDTIELFLDRDSLGWGDAWRERIQESLATVAFFIPVMTPRYFQSVECRRELETFLHKATEVGVRELLLPLHYVDVPGLSEPTPRDELMALVKTLQWADWRDLRLAARSTERYRVAVAELAQRLVRANQAVLDERDNEDGMAPPPDDEPGLLDRIALLEDEIPLWNQALEAIADEITAVGDLMRQGVRDVERANARHAGLKGRVAVTRRIARDLQMHADRILDLSTEFTTRLQKVDSGVRAYVELIPSAVAEDPMNRAEIRTFALSIEQLVAGANDGLGQTEAFMDTFGPLERNSRDMRPPLRTLRTALTSLLVARDVIGEWNELLRQTDIDGEGETPEEDEDEPG